MAQLQSDRVDPLPQVWFNLHRWIALLGYCIGIAGIGEVQQVPSRQCSLCRGYLHVHVTYSADCSNPPNVLRIHRMFKTSG